MNLKQRRALTITLIIALLFAAVFLRHYFSLIALAAIVAFLYNPIYRWLFKKTKGKKNLSVTITLFVAIITISIPVAIVLVVTVDQAFQVADIIKRSAASGTSIGDIINNVITAINHIIDKLPGHSVHHISSGQVFDWLKNNTSVLIRSSFNYVAHFAGSFASYLTKAVIFIFIFISFLKNQDKWLGTIRKLNPLGDRVSDLYLSRMAAMTSAMVKGQFTIALMQGLVDASLLYIAGIHYFIFWFVLVTFLSIIPLGGGILVIPTGIIMLITGNIWQGILLIFGHIVIVTNIDNVLRPRFVPRTARLDSSLTILSVFAGIAMFGFLGIVIGPVLMILIVTTIQVYLQAVEHDKNAQEVGLEE
ncbi:MAG TPA: AI-2E family transporter [Patescibacteria group bacterium]|nr:AI-2E family transporter [Patescibacteria group bacterium]